MNRRGRARAAPRVWVSKVFFYRSTTMEMGDSQPFDPRASLRFVEGAKLERRAFRIFVNRGFGLSSRVSVDWTAPAK